MTSLSESYKVTQFYSFFTVLFHRMLGGDDTCTGFKRKHRQAKETELFTFVMLSNLRKRQYALAPFLETNFSKNLVENGQSRDGLCISTWVKLAQQAADLRDAQQSYNRGSGLRLTQGQVTVCGDLSHAHLRARSLKYFPSGENSTLGRNVVIRVQWKPLQLYPLMDRRKTETPGCYFGWMLKIELENCFSLIITCVTLEELFVIKGVKLRFNCPWEITACQKN